ncbi:MAG: family 20 glycosylhydrolase, partial [Planctomycetota bacterium]
MSWFHIIPVLWFCLLGSPTWGQQSPTILPEPQSITVLDQEGMLMPGHLRADAPQDLPWAEEHLKAFGQALRVGYGQGLSFTSSESIDPPHLMVRVAKDLAPEAYRLALTDRIHVEIGGPKALAHATATLLQLWGPMGSRLPAVRIQDAPANPYRSLMVDLGRNPHSLTLMKETIDLLWFYKVDSLHLHLTDDQRFAFPSEAFPKLTSAETWTIEQFHALEAYAVARGVTLIPELESPGHGTLLRKHYPEVFGTNPTELASLPSAREGLKTLLKEMMDVFQSTPYLHIGGDEAYGVPHHLQHDLANDLHAFLKQHGRTAMVWEGPPLGEGSQKIDTDVIHFNWRTIDFPADAMLAAGYPVIQASWDPLYVVDHYPRNNFTMAAPAHIYRTLSRGRFGHFNPHIPTFTDPIMLDSADPQILGYCMPWWEGRETYFLP